MAALVLAPFGAREARADAPRPALVVTRAPGAEDCPDAARVTERVRGMTRGEPFEPRLEAPPDTWIQVEFSKVFSGYRAVIAARGRRHGTRSIDDVGPGCGSIGEAVAITLVMLLDPELPLPEPPPTPAPARRLPPPPASPPSQRVRFGGEVGGGVTVGVLERFSPFLEGGLTLRSAGWFGFGLGAGFVFAERVQVQSGRVELDLWYSYARALARLVEHGGTRLLLFAGPSTGSLRGAGLDYAENPDERRWWLAAVVGAELRAAFVPSFALTARVFALTPLRYDGFYVVDAGKREDVFRTPAFGGGLLLGVLAEP